MSKIAPCLWFNGQAEEAANYYVSLLPDGAITSMSHYGPNMPFPEGTALMVEFTLAGQRFQALNGGPQYQFNAAISLSIDCVDQAEVDRLWAALLAGGGGEVACGWITDRYGVSWQVVPHGMGEIIRDPDPARAGRAMQALMKMKKLDLAAMRAAADGAA